MTEESPSMIGRPVSTPEGDGPVVSDPAGELHHVLTLRHQAEDHLAEASETRRRAFVEATGILEAAQAAAAQLSSRTQLEAESTTDEARERAAGIVAGARQEADRLLAGSIAEADATRLEAQAQVADMQESVRTEAAVRVAHDFAGLQNSLTGLSSEIDSRFGSLRESLDRAESAVDDVTASFVGVQLPPGQLTVTESSLAEGGAEDEPEVTGATHEEVPESEAPAAYEPAPVLAVRVDDDATSPPGDEDSARPLGWLFRSPQP